MADEKMALNLFNTLSKKVEVFSPITEGQVKFYACGPTVYNFAHIGNLRTYIFEDVLKRTLINLGFKVEHVMNITDVGHLESDADEGEDKMEKASKKEKKSPYEIAKFYEEAFFSDIKKLNILMPNIICRATEHIKEMINMIKVLEEKGYTYLVDGNVYFSIDKFPDYTKLSGRNLEELKEGARVEIDSRKKNPLDFVLWFSKSKYPNQIMKWPSPWGEGFPGWHIECSAMASKYLGDHIDIHAGGIDHVSIHHTNEIAQSEGFFGHAWVNYWLHGEFLVLKKDKMSKSAGNFLTLQSLNEKGFHPLHFRYLVLQSHYRSQLLFSFEALEGAKNALEGLKNRALAFKHDHEKTKNEKRVKELKKEFYEAMCDDLNMPIALSVLWEAVKDPSLSGNEKLSLLKDFDLILGLDLDNLEKPVLTDAQMALINEREQARKNKNFAMADVLRDKLLREGIQIKDNKDGSTDWYFSY